MRKIKELEQRITELEIERKNRENYVEEQPKIAQKELELITSICLEFSKEKLENELKKFKEEHKDTKEIDWYNKALEEKIDDSIWCKLYKSVNNFKSLLNEAKRNNDIWRIDYISAISSSFREDKKLYDKYCLGKKDSISVNNCINNAYYSINSGTESIKNELNGIKTEIKKFRKGDKK